MRVFSTSFPVSAENTIEEILNHCLDSRRTNIHTSINGFLPHEIDFLGESPFRAECADELVEAHISEYEGQRIGYFKSLVKDGETDTWDIRVLIATTNGDRLNIHVTLDYASTSSSFVPPKTNKPYFFKKLRSMLKPVQEEGFSLDGSVNGGATEENLQSLVSSLDTGKVMLFSLPIVYVSRTSDKKLLIDVEQLAELLYGMAVVIVEPEELGFHPPQLPHSGALGCFDNGLESPWIFLPSQEEENKEISMRRIFNRVRILLLSKLVPHKFTYENYRDVLTKKTMQAIRRQNDESIDEIMREYEELLDDKKEQLRKKDEEIRHYHRERLNQADGEKLLATGVETDVYDGEMLDTILDVLKKEASNMGTSKHTRKFAILESILVANQPRGRREEIRKKLKTIFKGFRTVNAKLKADLRELGFEIEERSVLAPN